MNEQNTFKYEYHTNESNIMGYHNPYVSLPRQHNLQADNKLVLLLLNKIQYKNTKQNTYIQYKYYTNEQNTFKYEQYYAKVLHLDYLLLYKQYYPKVQVLQNRVIQYYVYQIIYNTQYIYTQYISQP
eukprot:EC096128.1.p3 GENE.EC096128.1~~EC096128.1.p3  ORF type:complete len:127 (-),score=8.81 EC096128.1:118-498(-)